MPFMHDGSVADLYGVVAHYASGGVQRPSLSPLMKPLDLNHNEIEDLIAFMKSLTGEKAVVALPILPN